MRAWRAAEFGPVSEVLKCVEAGALAPPPDGWATVKVLTASVNLPDVMMTRGGYPLVEKPPVSPGQEVCGVVTAVGPNSPYKIGDRVVGGTGFQMNAGSFAEYCYLREALSAKAPDFLSDTDAAAYMVNFQTAYTGLVYRANLQAGETLLVLGASGNTGAAAVALGKALGARVVAVTSGAEKSAFCQKIGADLIIDRGNGSIKSLLKEAGVKADVIYDPVGGEAYAQAVRAINTHGRVALIGYSSGEWARPDPVHMGARSYSVMGVFLAHTTREEIAFANEHMFSLLSEGKMVVPIAEVVSFDQVSAAIERVEKQETTGKIVVNVASKS